MTGCEHVNRPSDSCREITSWIDGKPADPSGAAIDVVDPSTGASISKLHAATEEDINTAVASARAAFPVWSQTAPSRRAALLREVASIIDQRSDEISRLEALDTGTPIAQLRGKVIPRAADNFRFFAETVLQLEGKTYPLGNTHLNYTLRKPAGVAALITPWNMPFMLGSWKVAPALAYGCTAILKPPELAPLTSALMAEICTQAGLPTGVLNVIQGDGPVAGSALVAHPDVDVISFTGSTQTGRTIVSNSARTSLKRLSMELGGKAPLIVFEDADYGRALDAAVLGTFLGNGQRCNASTRILAEHSIYNRFVEDFSRRAAALKVGCTFDETTRIGPLISADHLCKVQSYVDSGIADAARLVTGGGPPEQLPHHNSSGFYFKPTVFADVDNSMRIVREEIFGPVACIQPFSGEEEALSLANDSDYGLSAFVWTGDLEKGHRLADKLEVGMVWLNTQIARHLPAPFGGAKQSGFGREGGEYSLETYTDVRNVCLSLGNHTIPRW